MRELKGANRNECAGWKELTNRTEGQAAFCYNLLRKTEWFFFFFYITIDKYTIEYILKNYKKKNWKNYFPKQAKLVLKLIEMIT